MANGKCANEALHHTFFHFIAVQIGDSRGAATGYVHNPDTSRACAYQLSAGWLYYRWICSKSELSSSVFLTALGTEPGTQTTPWFFVAFRNNLVVICCLFLPIFVNKEICWFWPILARTYPIEDMRLDFWMYSWWEEHPV